MKKRNTKPLKIGDFKFNKAEIDVLLSNSSRYFKPILHTKPKAKYEVIDAREVKNEKKNTN